MASEDKEPRSVMSRNKGDSQVVSGARFVKHHRYSSMHKSTWPTNPDESLDAGSDTQHAAKAAKPKRTPKEKAPKPKKPYTQ